MVRSSCEVAVGDGEWQTLIAHVCDFVEGDKAMLLVSDRAGAYRHSLQYRHDSQAAQRYNSDWNIVDPRLSLSLRTPPGEARTGQEYLRNEDYCHTEYFNEITLAGNVMDSVHGVICDSPDLGRIAISVQRPFGKDCFDSRGTSRMRRALPFLEQAVRMSARIHLGLNNTDTIQASCLIDSDYNVRFADEDAVEILQSTGIGTIANGRLILSRNGVSELLVRSFDRPTLDRPIRFRIAGEPPLYYNFRLSEPPEEMSLLLAGKRQLLLSFGTSRDVPEDLSAQFAEAYGLTGRERDIVHQVTLSGNLRASADKIGISYETARNHLKHVYEKTNFRSLNDVVIAVRTGDLSNLL